MRKLFAVLALLALPVVAAAQPASGYVIPVKVDPVSTVIPLATGDNSPALVIKYFPTQTAGSAGVTATVAVEADGNLTFTVAGAAYAGFECPFAGALGGVLDVSNAECNTVGEVVQIINSTPITFATGYFRAAMVASLATDIVSTQAWLADAADTEVNRRDLGEIIYWDRSELDDDELPFWDESKGASFFIGQRDIAKNPFSGINTQINFGRFIATNGGTVGDFIIYAVKRNYLSGKGCNAAADCGQYSEVVRTVAVLPAATNTEVLTTTYFGAGTENGIFAKDEQVFMRMDSDQTSSAGFLVWSGYTYVKP
jgi:hypothetical protein